MCRQGSLWSIHCIADLFIVSGLAKILMVQSRTCFYSQGWSVKGPSAEKGPLHHSLRSFRDQLHASQRPQNTVCRLHAFHCVILCGLLGPVACITKARKCCWLHAFEIRTLFRCPPYMVFSSITYWCHWKRAQRTAICIFNSARFLRQDGA